MAAWSLVAAVASGYPDAMRPLCLALLLLVLPAQAQTAGVRVLMAGENEDDLADVLALAKGAKHRLWLFAYTLSDTALVQILAEKAKTPGFDLRVLIDSEQLKKVKARLEPLAAKLTPVVVPDKGRMHTKLILIDSHTILMGSKNWSDLGNRLKWNDVVVLRAGKKLVTQVEKTFQRLGGFKSEALPKTEPPEAPDAEAAKVELHFSAPGNPGARARAALLALVRKARKRIHLGMYILSDPELLKAIWLRRGRVEIRVVVDAIQYANLHRRVDAAGKTLLRYFADLGESVRLSPAKQPYRPRTRPFPAGRRPTCCMAAISLSAALLPPMPNASSPRVETMT